jgi:hypothetical protein
MHTAQRVFELGEQRLDRGEKKRSRRRESDSPRLTIQQRRAHRLFETLQLSRKRGLCESQRRRGSDHTSLLGHCCEVPQLTKKHADDLGLC